MESCNFVIKGRKFTTDTLNVGRFIDLHRMRSVLSGGTYGQMYRNALISSDEALMMIDIDSFMSVFCPDFITSLKPGTLRDLGLEDYLEIKEVYVTEILPWLEKVEGILKKKNDKV